MSKIIHKNHTIDKTGKLLEDVKQHPNAADYSKSPDYSTICYDTRPENRQYRYLRRTIRRAYQGTASESRTLRRRTCGTERDTGYNYLLLGKWHSFAHSGPPSEISDGARTKRCSKNSPQRIIAEVRNAPVDFITEVRKILLMLISGEYLDDLLARAKGRAAKNVILAIAKGINHKSEIISSKHCSRRHWGKTCQQLVNSSLIEYDISSKLCTLLPINGQKSGQNGQFFRCNVNVNVNLNLKTSAGKLFSEFIADIASFGRGKAESESLTSESLTQDWIDWSTIRWHGADVRHIIPFAVPPDIENHKIKHTEQIIGYLVHLTSEQRKIYKHNKKLIKKVFNEPGLCNDLIDRIVLMQFAIGIDLFNPHNIRNIRNWKKKCDQYKNRQEHSDKKSWICLAAMVQKIYERAGVKWAACKMRKEYEPLQDEAEMIRKGFYIDRLRTTKTFWQHQASKKYHQSGKTITDIVILQRELREDFYD